MTKIIAPILVCGVWLLAGCGSDPPPRSVREYLDNPIVLEAAIVRCAENRNETRYDAECLNARQAVSLIEARQERARHDALELQSQRKRDALRRTQQAVAEARRRARADAERRKEAAYLAQFGELPPPLEDEKNDEIGANAPGAVIPEIVETQNSAPTLDVSLSASDGGNAPVAESMPESDLEEVRRPNEELHD
ncbi:MAG: EexN family lipoprotein [Proteobacteria bacterium]|nr:EexN family lipoprotein [Pseudomonadota bacterium]